MKAFAVLISLLILAGTALGSTVTAYAPNDFAYAGTITGPLIGQTLYRFPLMAEILCRCNHDCSDLRIFDSHGAEVPYVIVEDRKPEQVPASHLLELVGFEERPSGMVITLRMPEKSGPVSQIAFGTDDKDFRKVVKIEASSDMRVWSTLAEDRIYDFSSQVDLRKMSVSFPLINSRYFRLTLRDEKARLQTGSEISLKYEGLDFRVSGLVQKTLRIGRFTATAGAAVRGHAAYDEQRLEEYTVSKDRDNNTIISFETGLPFTKIGLDLSHAYYFRNAMIFSSITGKEGTYRLLQRGTVYRFFLSDIAEQNNTMERQVADGRFYRVVIENRNNPPLDIRGITISWVRRHLFFVALADAASYTVRFGSYSAPRSDYDLAKSVNQSNWEQPAAVHVTISNIAHNAGYSPSVPGEEKAKREKLALIMIVCGLVAGIGVWLYRLLAKSS